MKYIFLLVAFILSINGIKIDDLDDNDASPLETYKKYEKFLPKNGESDRTSLTVDAFSKVSKEGAEKACSDRLNYTQE